MIENGFYKIKQEFIDLINNLGGIYKDHKERPIFCCIEDKYVKDLFWGIPTSDYSHRDKYQIEKIEKFCALDKRDIRYSYYFIGHTNRTAIYRISNCLPLIDKYIEGPYISQGTQLFLKNQIDIITIRKKIARILLDESMNPNKYEQHITEVVSNF